MAARVICAATTVVGVKVTNGGGMTALWLVLVLVYGACAGSYLGVVVDRLPRGQALVEASACGTCGRPVRARDNVPLLSYLLLRGRCRSCAASISGWWWLLEVTVTVLWVAAAGLLGPGLLLATVLTGSWLTVLLAAVCLLPASRTATGVRVTSWTSASLPPLALALQAGALGAAAQAKWGAAAWLGGAGALLLLLSVPLAPKANPVVAAHSRRRTPASAGAGGGQ